MIKLLKLILKNSPNLISKKGLFNKDTLIILKSILTGKIPNDFSLTATQKQVIKRAFIISNNTFDSETSPIIKDDINCALNTITKKINSLAFINWNAFNTQEIDLLIDKLIELNYILSENSPTILTDNKKIVLSSIKQNIENIKYASNSMKNDQDVFKYLLSHNYPFEISELENKNLLCLSDIDIMNFYFQKFEIYKPGLPITYIKNFHNLINGFLNSKPLIKDFEKIFQMIAESKWQEYKNDNSDKYYNIFGRTLSELQKNSDFKHVIYKLKYLNEMQSILKNKYDTLYQAMLEYSKIYHNNDITNKFDKIQPFKDTIANLSALYISKSKENYKKQCLTEYSLLILPYYQLRKSHPLVQQKIRKSHQKELFQKLYQLKDEKTIIFIADLIQKYSQYNPQDIIEYMINSFLIQQTSNLSEFMNIPSRYEEYQQFQKITKLINRLNSGYIKINGLEVANYKKFIKYDTTNQKYIYVGDNFTIEELASFNQYQKYEQTFSQIKTDIMQKVKTIEIDINIENAELKNAELKNAELISTFPFNDEYFEFN